jgi:hypothetical protein
MKTLFWNVALDAIDVDRDVDFVLTRVLERGKMADVHWVIRRYGLDRIHRFFRETSRPELSRRTPEGRPAPHAEGAGATMVRSADAHAGEGLALL